MSFNDIYLHGYDTQFATKENMKYIYLTTYISGKKYILEKLPKLFSGLHYTFINVIESHMIVYEDTQTLTLWHDRLGHLGSIIMRRIIKKSHERTLKGQKILQTRKISCEVCSLEKLIMRSSPAKIKTKSPTFLERIQGDICRHIHLLCGPFDTL